MGTVGSGSPRGVEIIMTEDTKTRRDDWKIAIDTLRIEVSSLRAEVATLVMQSAEIKELQQNFHELDKILIRGNGKPSLMEDMRNVLEFVKSIRFWMTALALAFISQFAAVTVMGIITIIRLMPAN